MSNIEEDDNRNKDDGKRRSARRISISHTNDNDGDGVTHTPMAKRLRFSPRNFKYCTDINLLPKKNQCSGCIAFQDYGSKPRGEHTTKKYQCYQAWKMDANTVPQCMQAHVVAVQNHIENNLRIDIKSLEEDSPVVIIEANSTPDQQPTTTTPLAVVEPTPTSQKRNITYELNEIYSQGQRFEFNVPSTHKIVHKNFVSRMEKDSQILWNVRLKLQQNQHYTDSVFGQSMWSIAMAACPALPLSAAQWLIPLIAWAFFYDTGLFDYKRFDNTMFARSFPSDNTLRKFCLSTAARDTMLLGHQLRDSKIYMSCDKGNKKGIGHFVKYIARWTPGKVEKHLLAIDASGGTSRDCAAAIQGSMNKLKLNDDDTTHLLYGTATDSGGGGTLELLHDNLDGFGLCCPPDEHIVSNCCIHALQLQLSNAVKRAFGEGALDKINAMQLIHSVWRLQESIDLDEWKHVLCLSSEWVANYDPTAIDDNGLTPAQVRNRNSFLEQYNRVLLFHSKFSKVKADPEAAITKATVLAKMQAPILTRWWTVGAASSFVFDYYLIIFHAAQTVINLYDSTSTPNGIASDLYSMMRDTENFIDMVLIRCFHKAYINTHFDWMQTCIDLTQELGFQAHNVVVRFYIMERELKRVMWGRSMEDYHEAIKKTIEIEESDSETETTRHLQKLNVFGNEAFDSLQKHFKRWMSSKLLPAAMLAEAPLARVVANIILGRYGMPTFTEDDMVVDEMRISGALKHCSEAHKYTINLVAFNNFVRRQLDDSNQAYTPFVRAAAEQLCLGADLRAIQYVGPIGEMRWKLHTTYLPVASMLQFVESGVKEAKYVSATDRSEVIRSCLAIIRSATPLGKSKVLEPELSFSVNKILAIIQSAIHRSDPHTQWIKQQKDDQSYDARLAQVVYSMKKGHFRNERIDTKKASVDARGSIFKKQNKHQQPKQQTLTAAVTGLIPYGRLVQSRHMDDLRIELLSRHVPEEEIPNSVTERKDMLRFFEIERLVADGMREEDAANLKTFKKLSNAPFKLNGA